MSWIIFRYKAFGRFPYSILNKKGNIIQLSVYYIIIKVFFYTSITEGSYSQNIEKRLKTVETRSISYVNVDNRSCNIIRFVVSQCNNRNVTFTKLSEPTISLESALTLSLRRDDFSLFVENEDELRSTFIHAILDKKEQAEREEKAQSEALEKIKREEEERKAVLNILRLETEDRVDSVHGIKQIDDEEVEREMALRADEAKERPVHMSPEQWEWYRKTGRMYPSRETGVTKHQSNSTFCQTKDQYAKQQRENFKQKLLTHPIKGDQFIDAPLSKRRGYILKWINNHQEEESLIVSLKELLSDGIEEGIKEEDKCYLC